MSDMHLRQLGICDPRQLNEVILNTDIIGSGGIGSSVAITLLKMGLKYVTVYDFDDLEEHNLGNQFLPHQIGEQNFLRRKKVEALDALVEALIPFESDAHQIEALVVSPEAYTPDERAAFLTISAVDFDGDPQDDLGCGEGQEPLAD